MDHGADAGRGGGVQQPLRARDVDRVEHVGPAARLDQPRQVHHGGRAAQVLGEVVGGDVGLHPADLGVGELRAPAGDPDDLFDGRLALERAQQRGPGVAGGARDDDAHQLLGSARAGMNGSRSAALGSAAIWRLRSSSALSSAPNRIARLVIHSQTRKTIIAPRLP